MHIHHSEYNRLLQRFAAAALTVIMQKTTGQWKYSETADEAFEYAEAMVREYEKHARKAGDA